jgi:hypothetical protein
MVKRPFPSDASPRDIDGPLMGLARLVDVDAAGSRLDIAMATPIYNSDITGNGDIMFF